MPIISSRKLRQKQLDTPGFYANSFEPQTYFKHSLIRHASLQIFYALTPSALPRCSRHCFSTQSGKPQSPSTVQNIRHAPYKVSQTAASVKIHMIRHASVPVLNLHPTPPQCNAAALWFHRLRRDAVVTALQTQSPCFCWWGIAAVSVYSASDTPRPRCKCSWPLTP